jgi:feruloyl esterase
MWWTTIDPSDTGFDTLRAWVENGTVPDRLEGIATDVGQASSFTCL